jgi:hypothetical protein
MEKNIQQIMDDLQNNIENSDFQAYCDSLMESLGNLPYSQGATSPLLMFMSNNPNLGMVYPV